MWHLVPKNVTQSYYLYTVHNNSIQLGLKYFKTILDIPVPMQSDCEVTPMTQVKHNKVYVLLYHIMFTAKVLLIL